jgi:hypothetical protein
LALIGKNDKKKWQGLLPDHMEYSCIKELQNDKDFISKLVEAGKKKREEVRKGMQCRSVEG